eukprot:6579865-Prorocentrum_lima.AAC.1
MTSSLVGSEMCIRDSSSIYTTAEITVLVNAAPRGGTVAVSPSQGVALTVSYTHLTLPTICSV